MKASARYFLLTLLTFFSFSSFSFDYDKALSKMPYPFVLKKQPPPVGVAIKDPVFATKITRLSDIRKGNPATKAKGIVNEYARADIANADGTLAILHGTNATWFLYDLKNHKNLGKLLSQGRLEPRWHVSDPNIFYYVQDTNFYQYNVSTKTKTSLYNAKKDYPNASWITSQGEGDSSADSRYWALMVVNYSNKTKKKTFLDWIVFDAEDKNVISRYADVPDSHVRGANTVTMSMSGKYILAETQPAQVFNRDWSNPRKLPSRYGHGDLALSKDGRDVFVAQDTKKDAIMMIYLDTLEAVKLMSIPFQSPEKGGVSYTGFHVSGNSVQTPGWVLVSTYGSKDHPTYWSDGSLFLLELKKNGRHLRVAHTNARTSKGGKDYWSEAFASIDRQGKHVYWGSNWGITGKGYADIYQVTLPQNWYTDLDK